MASKKPQKTQKKVSKTKQTSKPNPAKKRTVKTTKRTGTPKKAVRISGKTKKTKKATVKTPVAGTKKKEIKKTIAPKPVREKKAVAKKVIVKKVIAKAPEAKPKKKLSHREQKFQEIKKILIMQRNTLLSEAEEALNELPGQTIFPDMGDQASAEIDRSFMLRLRGREQRLLKKIEAAIEKIDSGAFGICDVCGEEISVQRLEARPVTNMCIFCKTEQEEEEKLRGT
jgi:DnaK suppressor protein